MKLRMLFGLGLAALISCSQSDESVLAKKAKEEFLRNENEIYQKYKEDKRAELIGYKLKEIIKSDKNNLGEWNIGWAVKNCELGKGVLEMAWIELAVKCPENGCYASQRDYARIEYGFVKDKNNKWCHFMNSFKFNNKYFDISAEYIKDFKKL